MPIPIYYEKLPVDKLITAVEEYVKTGRVYPPIAKYRMDAEEQSTRAVDCLRKRLDELDHLDEILERIVTPLRSMRDLILKTVLTDEEVKRFNTLHAEMNKWRLKIDTYGNVYSLIVMVSQSSEFKRFCLDTELAKEEAEAEEIEERRKQLKRDLEYISRVQETSKTLRKSFEESIERLQVPITSLQL